ncbi:MAG: ubiquitin-like small modifier protein 1 [Actinomycetota bacterium]
MSIEVRVPTVLRKHTGGERAVGGEGATIAEVLKDLDAKHPGLRDAVLDDSGELARFINMYLNDEDVRYLQSLETPVKDGDTLSILPAVAGGR